MWLSKIRYLRAHRIQGLLVHFPLSPVLSSVLQGCVIEVHSTKEQSTVPAPNDIVTAKVGILEYYQFYLLKYSVNIYPCYCSRSLSSIKGCVNV